MQCPFIGITTSCETASAGLRQTLNHDYVAAVERAGGCPVILPMAERPDVLRPLFDLLDCLVLTGGPGITEGLVGDLPDDLPPVAPLRYRNDIGAFEAAQQKRIPILGICYGMQFINARCGGTLYADVQHQLDTPPHSPKRAKGASIRHVVAIEPGTHLAALLDATRCETNSYHLQAIENPGNGLRVSARSADRVIEGIETPDGRIIGVQFHPEKMPGPFWDRIFMHLVTKAKITQPPTGRNAHHAPQSREKLF